MIFRPHLRIFVVFLDNILIYSWCHQEHKEHFKEVLKFLKLINYLEKCKFFIKEGDYLGHIVLGEGVKADPKKLKVMDQWPTPKNLKSLRAFIGLT